MLGFGSRGVLALLVAAAFSSGLIACAAATKKAAKNVADASGYGTDDPGDPALPGARPPDYNNPDSGAFAAGERARDAQAPLPEGGARPAVDAGNPGTDAASACPVSPGPGDLAIVEFLIQSQSGVGDRGEWVEIQNTHPNCTLNLNGLHIESPRGTDAADYVDIDTDLMLAPNKTIVVADSTLGELNHDLPGTVVSWDATDALVNDGDTITVSMGGTVIDSVTYGAWGAHVGRSVAFPVDCLWSDRSDFSRWSWTYQVYGSASSGDGGTSIPLDGTPNADNADVTCY